MYDDERALDDDGWLLQVGVQGEREVSPSDWENSIKHRRRRASLLHHCHDGKD